MQCSSCIAVGKYLLKEEKRRVFGTAVVISGVDGENNQILFLSVLRLSS